MTLARCVHRLYKLLLSPWFGCSCRFVPTCSDYALEAVEKRGFIIGTGLTIARLLRCHPFCEGGYDPVPSKAAKENQQLESRQ